MGGWGGQSGIYSIVYFFILYVCMTECCLVYVVGICSRVKAKTTVSSLRSEIMVLLGCTYEKSFVLSDYRSGEKVSVNSSFYEQILHAVCVCVYVL